MLYYKHTHFIMTSYSNVIKSGLMKSSEKTTKGIEKDLSKYVIKTCAV